MDEESEEGDGRRRVRESEESRDLLSEAETFPQRQHYVRNKRFTADLKPEAVGKHSAGGSKVTTPGGNSA